MRMIALDGVTHPVTICQIPYIVNVHPMPIKYGNVILLIVPRQ